MAEKVGTIYYDLDLDDAKYKSKANSAGKDADNFGQRLQNATVHLAALGAVAGVALTKVVNYLEKSVDAAVKQQNALMGLSSVAAGTGNDINKVTEAAKQLASDGLMPLGDSAMGLKNLLASGFSLPQAIKLMNAFKDSAAFGRQGSLEFGQAIVGATEGVKNGNSMLVDNAGVTKNLSNILVEAGFSAQDLSKATTDANVRMALFNGIVKETKNQTGDAAKLSESFGGAMARQSTQVTNLQVALGTALQPILTKIMDTLAPIIEAVMNWVKANPQLVAAIAAGTVVSLALAAAIGLIAAAIGAVMVIGAPLVATAAAIAVGIGALVAGLILAEQKFGLVSKTMAVLGDVFTRVKDVVVGLFDLFVRGDITGSFLRAIGQTEDSPLIGVLWKMHEAMKAVGEYITGVFGDIWRELQGIFEQLATALKPVFDALGKVFSAIGDFVSKHGKTIMTVLKGIGIAIGAIAIAPLAIAFGVFLVAIKAISVVLGFINKHFDIIKRVILTVIAIALAPLIATVLLLIGAFKAVVWIAQTLWTVFTTVFNAIWAVVSFVFNAIMLLWTTVLSPVFNAIMFILTALFKIWWSIFTGILTVVSTVISTIAQIIFVILKGVFLWIVNTFLKPLFNFYAAIFTAIWSVVSTIFNAIRNVIVSVLGAIFNVVRSVFNGILGFVRSVWNWIRDAIISPIVGAAQAVGRWIGNIKDKVVEGIRSAVRAVGNFVSDAVNAGKNLIDGIVKGVGNAKDAVVNKVKEICSGALDAVKSFFGISSPSRVMAEMGDFMMQGMQNGITKAGGAVVNAATAISDKIAGGMSNSLKDVSQGARNVVGVYRGMYGQLSAMNMASSVALNGSVSAMDRAAQQAQNGGAIAQPPINVTLKQDGIVARSRSEFRDIIADGIEAVNEDLRARGYDQIGNGKVKGQSTSS